MKRRWIMWDGRPWGLRELAGAYGLAPGTLHARLQRYPDTATGVQRALTTGIATKAAAGRVGAGRTCWGR